MAKKLDGGLEKDLRLTELDILKQFYVSIEKSGLPLPHQLHPDVRNELLTGKGTRMVLTIGPTVNSMLYSGERDHLFVYSKVSARDDYRRTFDPDTEEGIEDMFDELGIEPNYN